MANRHLSRSIVLQTLFEKDFNELDDSKVDFILKRNVEEFAPGLEDSKFAEKILTGVLKKQKKLDKIIEKAAPEWPIGQIAIVDRNVLRMGLYELLFSDKQETPPKVAINESIELAKSFGGDSSGRFVNGVLGAVYREIVPEGEADQPEKMIEEKLGGAVVYKKDGDKYKFALVHDVFGYWTLSKGRIEEGESVKEGAAREVKEEIGLTADIGEELGVNEYVASDPERGKIKKSVTYFLAETKDENIVLKETGGLDNAQWFEMDDLGDLKMYDDIRNIMAKAIGLLKK